VNADEAALAELYDNFEQDVKAVCDLLLPKIREYEELLTGNRIWMGRLQGIGVAIRKGDRVMGCLSMRFIRSAMTEQDAGARYGAPLNALASAIAADAER